MGQSKLAARSNISIPTLKRMESREGSASGMANNVAAVRAVLETAGVEFTNGGQSGVRLLGTARGYTGGAIDASEPDKERRPSVGGGKKGNDVKDGTLIMRALAEKAAKRAML